MYNYNSNFISSKMEEFKCDTDFLSYIRKSIKESESESGRASKSKIRDPRFFGFLVEILNSILIESKYFYDTLKVINNFILNSIGVTNCLKEINEGAFRYLKDYLFPRHPNHLRKVKNLVNIGIRKNPGQGHLEFIIIKNNGKIDDISANYSCVFKRNRGNDLHQTMLKTISRCRRRNNEYKDINVKGIANRVRNQFLESWDLPVPTTFDDDLYWGGTKFKECDSAFEEAWISYYFNYCRTLKAKSG